MNRILLILASSLAPVLCWAVEPNADQAKAIAEIEKLGGKVTIDEKSPDKPVIDVSLNGDKVTDAWLEHLDGLRRPAIAGPLGAPVSDPWLGSPQRIGPTPIADVGVYQGHQHWIGYTSKGFTGLQSLTLRSSQGERCGLEHIKGLTKLQSLDFGELRLRTQGWFTSKR